MPYRSLSDTEFNRIRLDFEEQGEPRPLPLVRRQT